MARAVAIELAGGTAASVADDQEEQVLSMLCRADFSDD